MCFRQIASILWFLGSFGCAVLLTVNKAMLAIRSAHSTQTITALWLTVRSNTDGVWRNQLRIAASVCDIVICMVACCVFCDMFF